VGGAGVAVGGAVVGVGGAAVGVGGAGVGGTGVGEAGDTVGVGSSVGGWADSLPHPAPKLARTSTTRKPRTTNVRIEWWRIVSPRPFLHRFR